MAHGRRALYFERPNVNKGTEFWKLVHHALERGVAATLLVVVESLGSSPGRAGFKALVTEDGALYGSIGGGSMEHKLVEFARSRMASSSLPTTGSALMSPSEDPILLKRQVHRSDEPAYRSGMICSGEQTVAFVSLAMHDRSLVQRIVDELAGGLNIGFHLDRRGIRIGNVPGPNEHLVFTRTGETWTFSERLGAADRIVILGAGHVGLALSRTMHQLGFHVHVMDDRPGLNTMDGNHWAHERTVVDYARIGEWVEEDPKLYVVLVSFGYRTDDILVRQLIRKKFNYLGMMGSAEKVRVMFEAMLKDGFTEEELKRLNAPIGLPIHSRTPEEIAVSIAAQIISVRNDPQKQPFEDPARPG